MQEVEPKSKKIAAGVTAAPSIIERKVTVASKNDTGRHENVADKTAELQRQKVSLSICRSLDFKK